MSLFKIPSITKCIFSTELEVRIDDINYGNHLGHDSLITLLHEARARLLAKFGFTELNIHGLGILVTNLAVNYLKEAYYGEILTIKIGVDSIERTGVNLLYEVVKRDSEIEVAKAMTTITFYDYQKKKVAKTPEEFCKYIETADLS